jgi:hypothetical protein
VKTYELWLLIQEIPPKTVEKTQGGQCDGYHGVMPGLSQFSASWSPYDRLEDVSPVVAGGPDR